MASSSTDAKIKEELEDTEEAAEPVAAEAPNAKGAAQPGPIAVAASDSSDLLKAAIIAAIIHQQQKKAPRARRPLRSRRGVKARQPRRGWYRRGYLARATRQFTRSQGSITIRF